MARSLPTYLYSPAWALDLDFMTGSLDSRITFSRASTATRVNASGAIESVATGLPRFDYSPTSVGTILGLLVEEARTNLFVRSAEHDNAAWGKTASTVTPNAVTSPDGTTNADKLVENSATSQHSLYYASGNTLTAAAYTVSWFLKAGERTKARLSLGTGALAIGASVIADLSAGTLSAVTAYGGATGTSARIQDYGNGWYRVSLTVTATAALYYGTVDLITGTSTDSYAGDGTSGLYGWGSQLELGAFSTSYIPTTTAAIVRLADSLTMTGTNFSDWYNQTAGTFVVHASTPASGTRYLVAANDATNNERNGLFTNSTFALGGTIDGAVTQASITAGSISPNTAFKLAYAYAANDFATSFNGAAAVTDVSGSLPTPTQLSIGNNVAGTFMCGHVRGLTYYNTRKTNVEIAGLTA